MYKDPISVWKWALLVIKIMNKYRNSDWTMALKRKVTMYNVVKAAG